MSRTVTAAITETCSCGASFTVEDGSLALASIAAKRWRVGHEHKGAAHALRAAADEAEQMEYPTSADPTHWAIWLRRKAERYETSPKP